jgi:hypothetical protein
MTQQATFYYAGGLGTAFLLAEAVSQILEEFARKGMVARQVVLTGPRVPSADQPVAEICGLPVGWIGRGDMPLRWSVEIVGRDFAYASASVEPTHASDGLTIVPRWPAKRQPLWERCEEWTKRQIVTEFMEKQRGEFASGPLEVFIDLPGRGPL